MSSTCYAFTSHSPILAKYTLPTSPPVPKQNCSFNRPLLVRCMLNVGTCHLPWKKCRCNEAKCGEGTKNHASRHPSHEDTIALSLSMNTKKTSHVISVHLRSLLLCLPELTSSSHAKLPLAYLPLELRALAAGPKDHVLAILRAFTRTLS